jgi:hypothetical protein
VVLVQETSFIAQLEMLRERDWLASRVWWAVISPALPGQSVGRSSWVAILARRQLDIADAGGTIFEGRARSLTIRPRAGGLVELVCVHAKDNVGPEGNQALLGAIADRTTFCPRGCPALWGGGFQHGRGRVAEIRGAT